MRPDGRKNDQLRPVTITPNVNAFAEGSALIEVGATRVLCTLTIENTVPRWMQIQGKPGGWLTAEYAMLPRATHTRTPRENNGIGGRTHEIRRLLGRSLRAAIDLEQLGARTCLIDCDVLQADGGTRTAAITGGYVALALGLKRLIEQGLLSPQVLRHPVAAVSMGIVHGEPMLDLCYAEDSAAEVDANLVMNAAGQIIEIQGTAEGPPFERAILDTLLDLGWSGIHSLLAFQESVL